MNKIYKVVWNSAQGEWTVVSEFAKGKTKSASTGRKQAAAATAFVVAASVISPSVMAAKIDGANVPTFGGKGTNLTIASQNGPDASVSTTNQGQPVVNQIAIGNGATTQGSGDLVIGHNAKALYDSTNTVKPAIKDNLLNGTLGSTVVGSNAQSTGHGDVMIGSYANNRFGQTIVEDIRHDNGTIAGNRTTRVGQSTAVGSRTFVYGDQATALGADTTAIGHSSIAIGGDDIDRATAKLKLAIPQLTTQKVDLTKMETVGEKLKKDGVSTAALKLMHSETALYPKSANKNDNGTYKSQYVRTTAGGDASIAFGVMAQTAGTGSMAVGVNALAFETGSIAQGVLSRAHGVNSIATGSVAVARGNSSSAIGHGSHAQSDHSIAFGTNSHAYHQGSTAVGQDTFTGGYRSVALGHNAATGQKKEVHEIFIKISNDIKTLNTKDAIKKRINDEKANLKAKGLNDRAFDRLIDRIDSSPNDINQVRVNVNSVINGLTGQQGTIAIGNDSYSGAAAGAIAIGDNASTTSDMAPSRHIVYFNPHNKQTLKHVIVRPNDPSSTIVVTTADDSITNHTERLNASVRSASTAIGRDAYAEGGGVALGDSARTKSSAVSGTGTRALGVAIGANALSHAGSVAIGSSVEATGFNAMAFGRQAAAVGNNSQAIGSVAAAVGSHATAIGHSATAEGVRSIAIGSSGADEVYSAGTNTQSKAQDSIAVGSQTITSGEGSVALGRRAAAGKSAAAQKALRDARDELATQTNHAGIRDVLNKRKATAIAAGVSETEWDKLISDFTGSGQYAVGNYSNGTNASNKAAELITTLNITASDVGVNAISIGTGSEVLANNSIAIGTGNSVRGENSGAFGDPSIVAGTGSYSAGNNNLIGTNANSSFVFGSQNDLAVNSNGVRNSQGIVDPSKALTDIHSAHNSVVLGTKNVVHSNNVMVLGNNINVNDQREGAVILGHNSSAVVDVKAVNGAEVNGIHYSKFAGNLGGTGTSAVKAANNKQGQFVSIGSQTHERQLKHVAAGEISATSTDAINGSQLYMTQEALGNVGKTAATHLGGGAALTNTGAISAPAYNIKKPDNSNYNSAPINNVGGAITSLNDYVNEGFTVEGNGAGTNKVRPTQKINFTNGTATTAVVGGSDGAPTVKFDLKYNPDDFTVDATKGLSLKNKTTPPGTTTPAAAGKFKLSDGGTGSASKVVETNADEASAPTIVVKGSGPITSTLDTGSNTFTIGANIAQNIGTESNGSLKVDPASEGDKLVNTSTLVDAVNKASFTVSTNNTNIEITAQNGTTTVQMGNTLAFEAGKNLNVHQNGKTIAFGLAKDIDVNKISFNGKPSITSDGDNIKLGDTAPIKITNLANGSNPNDAVNFSQLKDNRTFVTGNGHVNVTSTTNATDGGKDFTVSVNTSTLDTTKTDGTAALTTPTQDGLVTGVNAVAAMNNLGFKVTAGSSNGGATTGGTPSEELVKVGETLELIAGENVNIAQNGKKFTISAKVPAGTPASGGSFKVQDGAAGEFTVMPDASSPAFKITGEGPITTAVDTANKALKVSANIAAESQFTNGSVNAPAADGSALVNATNLVNTVNNAGWNVYQGGADDANRKGLVKAGNKVVFADGTGTKANVTTAGDTTTVKFNINIAPEFTVEQDVTQAKVGVVVASRDDEFANASSVAKAINASGWKLGDNAGAAKHLISPSKQVNFVNGNGTIATVADGTNGANVSFDVANTQLPVTPGQAVTTPAGDEAKKFVNAGDLAEALNNLSFNVVAEAQGGTLVGGAAAAETVTAGNTVKFIAGDNISIQQTGKEFKISATGSLAPAPTGFTVSTGKGTGAGHEKALVTDTTNSPKLIITGAADSPISTKVSEDSSNAKVELDVAIAKDVKKDPSGSLKIEATTPEEGAKLVNATTLVNAVNNASFKVSATNNNILVEGKDGTAADVQAGNTLNFQAGKNLKVNHENARTLAFGLADEIEVKSVQLGNGGPKLSNDGSNNIKLGDATDQPVKITNLKAGEADTDAVNVAQLKEIQSVVKSTDGSINVDIETNTTTGQKTYNLSVVGGAGGAAPATTNLTVATNGTVETPTGGEEDKFVKAGNLAKTINDTSWTLAGGDNVTDKKDVAVKAGKKITLDAGKNIAMTQTDDGFTFATKDDVIFNSVQLGGDTGPKLSKDDKGNIKLSDAGTGPVKLTNLANGTNPNDAVNLSQLNASKTIVAASGLATVSDNSSSNPTSGVTYTVNVKESKLDTSKDTGMAELAIGDAGDGAVTASNVKDAVNNLGFKLKASASTAANANASDDGTNSLAKVGSELEFEAGENVQINRTGSKFTISAKVPAGTPASGGSFNVSDNAGGNLNIAPAGTAPTLKIAGEGPISTALDNTNNTLNIMAKVADTISMTDGKADAITAPADGSALVNATNLANTINEAGWVVYKGDGTVSSRQGVVKSGNKVIFANGKGTQADVTVAGETTTVKFNIDEAPAFTVNTTLTDPNAGQVVAPEGAKFANASTVADAINASGWKLGDSTGAAKHLISPSKQVNFVNGEGTTAKIVDGGTNGVNVSFDVANTKLPVTPGQAVAAPSVDDAKKFVNAGDLAEALNNLSFNVVASGNTVGTPGETPVKAGDKVEFVGGDNITIEQTGSQFKISATGKLAPAPTGFTVSNGAGAGAAQEKALVTDTGNTPKLIITGATDSPITTKVSADGSNAKVELDVAIAKDIAQEANGSLKIDPAAVGEGAKLVNATTLVNAVNNASFTVNATNTDTLITANNSTTTVQMGQTLDFQAGKNLNVHQNGRTLAFGLADEIEVKSVQLGNGGPKLSNDGSNNIKLGDATDQPVKITNLKAGEADTDAVNVEQLKAIQPEVKSTDNSVEVVTTTDSTGRKTFDLKVVGGAGGAAPATTDLTVDSNGTVNAPASGDENKFVKASNLVETFNNTSWTLAGGANVTDKQNVAVKAGKSITLDAGKNIAMTQTDEGFTFATKDDVVFNSVQLGGDTGPKLSKDDKGNIKLSDAAGNGSVKLTNVAAGEGDNDAVNLKQLKDLQSVVKAGTGVNVSKVDATKDKGAQYTVNVNTVNFKAVGADGRPKLADDTDAGNKFVTAENLNTTLNSMGFKASVDKTGNGSAVGATTLVKAGDEVKFIAGEHTHIEQNGTNFTISSNLKAGSNITISKDGVISATGNLSAKPTGFTVATDKTGAGQEIVTTENNAPRLIITGAADSPITTSVSNDGGAKVELNVSLASGVKADANGQLVFDPATTAAEEGKKLVNGTTLINAVNSAGFKVTSVNDSNQIASGKADATGVIVKPGSNISYKAGKNLLVAQNGTEIAFGLAEEIDVKKVTLNGGPSITANGSNFDFGGAKLGNIAAGEDDGDAVNLKQLKAIQPVVLSSDGSVAVNTTTDATGKKTFDLKVVGGAGGAAPATTDLTINNGSVVVPTGGDEHKFVKAGNLAETINNTSWTLAGGTDVTNATNVAVKPGKKITLNAGKNIAMEQTADGFTFATKDDVTFDSVQLGSNGPKFSNDGGNIKLGGGTTGNDAVQLTNLAAGAKTFAAPQNAAGEALKLANDGKWYKATDVQPNGTTVASAVAQKPTGATKNGGLVDFANSNPSNALSVADAQNMGWVLNAGNYSDQVRHNHEVKFVGTNGVTVTGDTDNNGVRVITIAGNGGAGGSAPTVIQPVVYTTADGTKVYKQGDGSFNTAADGSGVRHDAGNVIASLNTGTNQTQNDPLKLANLRGNLQQVSASGAVFDPVNNSTSASAANALKQAPQSASDVAALRDDVNKRNHAATLGDVLNTGFNLQANGNAQDFVRHADGLNFADGLGSSVKIETAADGTSNRIQINTATAYTDANGTPLLFDSGTGQYHPIDPATGKADTSKAGVSTPKISLADAQGNTNKPMQLGNLAQGAGVMDGTVNKAGTALPAGNRSEAYKGLADLNNANLSNNAMTVADAKNMGWVLSASGNTYSDKVQNADEVEFVGGSAIDIKGETKDGKRIITVNVDTSKIAAGGTVVKGKLDVNNGKAQAAGNDDDVATIGDVANVVNNTGWTIASSNGGTAAPTSHGTVKPSGVVVYSGGKGTKANVSTSGTTGNFNVSFDVNKVESNLLNTTGGVASINTPPAGTTAPDLANSFLSAQDTLNLVNNTGFQLNTGKAADQNFFSTPTASNSTLVKAGSSVNYQAGKNMEVKRDGNNIVYATSKDVEFETVNVSKGLSVAKGATVDMGGNRISNVAAGTDPNDVVTVAQLEAKALKGSRTNIKGGAGVTVTGDDGETNAYVVSIDQDIIDGARKGATAVQNIAAGSRNVHTSRQGDTVYISVDENPVFQNTTTQTLTTQAITVQNSDPSRAPIIIHDGTITGLNPGRIAPDSFDAVNGAQLHAAYNDINGVRREARGGVASAIATAGLPQAYLPGKSLIAGGVSTYRGKTGFALGISSISDGGNWIVKGTVSGAQGAGIGASAAIGYQW